MPCVIQIKDDITSTIEEMSGNYTNKTPSFIKILQNTINNRFKVSVITFLKQTDDTFLSKIHIPQSLIDEYYKNELLIEGERDVYEEDVRNNAFNEYGTTHEEWNNASESEREMIIWQSKNNC